MEWDDRKNQANFAKHGVWFEEASTVIEHPLSRDFFDPDNSERTLCLGYSRQQRILFVVYLEKKTTYRIISARKATSQERQDYEEGI
jgi:uncharacterized DUF497 family protein